MKNLLVVGLGEKPELLSAERGFLFIDDEVPDIRADVFDPAVHSFNPLKGIDVRRARDIAKVFYGEKDLMTYRDGKRALTKMLSTASRLDKLPRIKHKGYEDARDTVDDLLLSPLLRRVLCDEPNFNFRSRPIVVRLNRAEIGDDDALILCALVIMRFKGQIVIRDFGAYARPFHAALIRQNRLMAGVHTFSELEPSGLLNLFLLQEKEGRGCIYEDAQRLAKYAKLYPDNTRQDNPYNKFIERVMG